MKIDYDRGVDAHFAFSGEHPRAMATGVGA